MELSPQRKVRLPDGALFGRLTGIYYPRRDLDPDAKPPDGMRGTTLKERDPCSRPPPSLSHSSSVLRVLPPAGGPPGLLADLRPPPRWLSAARASCQPTPRRPPPSPPAMPRQSQ